jgi:hypothetical protein
VFPMSVSGMTIHKPGIHRVGEPGPGGTLPGQPADHPSEEPP